VRAAPSRRRVANLPQRVGRIVLVELPAWQLLVLAAAVGAVWAASLFDWSFVAGRSTFWRFPSGPIGKYDLATGFVGYLYYVQSPWRLPLFYVSALGTPAGTNIIFLDVVPIVALVGKLIYSVTGTTTNLYGPFFFLCFALPGVMMTLVLIAAGIRYGLAAIIAAIFANATSGLLWQWGHTALVAQFLPVGALALYLLSLKAGAWRRLMVAWIAYLILSYLTNMYLFAMVGVVWICAVIQRRLNRFAATREVLGTVALTVALVTIVIALGGQFVAGNIPFSTPYGVYSMNLASPFVPQLSGLLPWLGGVIDATGGQYEGLNYLGLGLLLASLLVLPVEAIWIIRNLRRHVALFVAFVALTAFAVSNRVFLGHWQLFELPLPHYLITLFGIFRSSGRFFWLICYAQIAIVIILGFGRAQPLIALCLAGAAIVQLLDMEPLRERIIATIANTSGAPELDPVQVARLAARARHLDVVPSFQCYDAEESNEKTANVVTANLELMLAAARVNVPINTVYMAQYTWGTSWLDYLRETGPTRMMLAQARRDDYCSQEIERARSGGRPGDVLVLLSNQPPPDEILPEVTCAPLSWARYCHRKPEPGENRIQ
jgi:hypothetical protein